MKRHPGLITVISYILQDGYKEVWMSTIEDNKDQYTQKIADDVRKLQKIGREQLS